MNRPLTLVSGLALSLGTAASAAAQLPPPNPTPRAVPRATWVLTPGVTGTPTQRRDNTGAASNDKMYVFGGRSGNATTTVLNALYEFDGTTWTLKTAEGAAGSPPARGGACVAWNFASNKLVVFGGDDGAGNFFGDTWEWDPTTNAWTNVNPVLAPSARRFSAMTFDPTWNGMLLFGGEEIAGGAPSDQTWLLVGGAWAQLSPNTVPPRRRLHSLVTRSNYGDVFLCAGDDPSVTPNIRHLDAWRWTGADWIQLVTTTFPHGTTANQAIYDPLRRRVVLQGGQGISVPNTAGGGQYGNDYGGSPSTWCSEFDCITNSWTLYGAAAFGTADPVIGRISRYFGAFIPALGRIYKVSGQNPSGTGTITGTCHYQAVPVAEATSVGSACAGLALGGVAPNERPWLGRNFTSEVTGLAAGSLVIAVFGATSTPTPLSLLHPAGVVGCDLLASLDIMVGLANTAGSATVTVPVPDVNSLIAAPLYHQMLQIQISGLNITALTSSNGLALQFGKL